MKQSTNYGNFRRPVPLSGDTCLMVCISGIEHQPVSEIKYSRGQDGAIALVMQPHKVEGVEVTNNQHSSVESKFRNSTGARSAGRNGRTAGIARCNDECPNGCMKDIEPYKSDHL